MHRVYLMSHHYFQFCSCFCIVNVKESDPYSFHTLPAPLYLHCLGTAFVRASLVSSGPCNMLKGTFLSILIEVLERNDSEVLGNALLSPSRES